MNVLSLFDGMSCGQLALQRASINVNKYYASEITTSAITITQKNFPDTIQLGDATKYNTWNLDKIDLLMGGSPCQGFSVNGKLKGFDDPRSKLFYVFADALMFFRPKYFLLENVQMKPEWSEIITKTLGVEPILINSALVSGQHRLRNYWTNIPNITPPKDLGICLDDVLENGIATKKKAGTVNTSTIFRGNIENKKRKLKNNIPLNQAERRLVVDISAGGAQNWRSLTVLECERLQTVPDGYTSGVSNAQRIKMLGNGWTVDVISHILSFIPKE